MFAISNQYGWVHHKCLREFRENLDPQRLLDREDKTQEIFQKITENGRFRVQKNGTSDAQIQKRRPLFVKSLY